MVSNPDMYAMETYDKIFYRTENKKEKKWGRWDGLYATIGLIAVDILVVRSAFNVSVDDFAQLGDRVSKLIFVDGLNVWTIIILVMIVAVVVMNIIASTYIRSIKKAVIKEEYEEKKAFIEAEEKADVNEVSVEENK